ncbi:regulator of (H+)-ATPase in vacuolar membrane [Lithohypha guttulata]|uniref:Regulator of (H+)-ATPase in vacuolar membrane n=1 Tax=Lithohypha guttulata TaxID=1690604 RepID=A0AAN7SYQ0_9EURO|nr:regulator of (H+)-ATPase in vacuolar membrane [Lithohypha guttulata]
MRNILPGRPQSSRQALCTVNWDGLRLVAYISGTTVIVFNGRREVLQSILVDDANSLFSLSIDEQSGNIAVADKSSVYIYRPIGRDYGDLRWTRTHVLPKEVEPSVTYLSWGSSDELLVAAQSLTLWSFLNEHEPQPIWTSPLSSPVQIAAFSPDAGLIASCGYHDRIVKVWRRLSYEQDSTRFDVSYLPHPSAIADLSWRHFWHQEQNLDNLLYTFCNDKQARSQDLARAAERALQIHRNGTNHALEHLIEVANRSPEICVILDGLGHMSAWGIENAGLKSKLAADKFNVALVDGVNVTLPMENDPDGFTQIHAFANNDASASLCVLVHSYSGQIDWYQGSFVEFFDTSARAERIRLQSCWSGHDSVVDRMVSSSDYQSFLSLTESDQVILWSKALTGAPIRKTEAQSHLAIVHATLLVDSNFAVLLHDEALSVWDMRGIEARRVSLCQLKAHGAKAVHDLGRDKTSPGRYVGVLYEDNLVECYKLYVPEEAARHESNGYHDFISRIMSTKVPVSSRTDTVGFCTTSQAISDDKCVFSLSQDGSLRTYTLSHNNDTANLITTVTLSTNIQISDVVSVLDGNVCAIVHADNHTVSVWNSKQGLYEFTHTFDDFDCIHELSWYRRKNGVLLLAAQSTYAVAILAQQRYGMDTVCNAWSLQRIIYTRAHSSHTIGSLSWFEPFQVAVGLGSQIMTFDIESDARPTNDSELSGRTVPAYDVEARHMLRQSSLPMFAPEIVARQLQAGQYDALLVNLQTLCEETKFLSQNEAVHIDVDVTLAKVLARRSSDACRGGPNPALQPTNASDFSLSEVKEQLNETIMRIAPYQLTRTQKTQLQGLIRTALRLFETNQSLDAFSRIYLFHFLSAFAHHDAANGVLPALPYVAIVYASQSQTQEALLQFILARIEEKNIKLTWSTARSLGIFLFISDKESLMVQLESVARNEYNRNTDDRNPVDCSLYYLALDKKAVLLSLWRRTIGVKEKESTIKLLSRDFQDPKWKSTALKNAYALLSRRRFEYAVAFFLLGGSLADAVSVCVNQLHDFQLAVAITRVWTGNVTDQSKAMLNLTKKVIPELAVDSSEARWMLIWSCVQSQDWPQAVRIIVYQVDDVLAAQLEARKIKLDQQQHEAEVNMPVQAMSYKSNEPTLLINFYEHLRTKLLDQGLWTRAVITPTQEWQFVTRSASWYARAGLDWLALELVVTWQFVKWQEPKRVTSKPSTAVAVDPDSTKQKSMLDDWTEPEVVTGYTSADTKKQLELTQEKASSKPKPTQFVEPSADSLLDSFGF